MKDYLENRIKELKEADAKFCADRWDMSKHQLVRLMARENSNSVTLARQELERALDVFNKLNIDSVSNSLEQTIYVTNSSPNDVYAAFDSKNRSHIESEESGCYTTEITLYKGERV